MSYFSVISDGIRSTLKGLGLTARHLRKATQRRTSVGVADAHYFDLKEGLVTLQYPHEALPIPDNGRYRLHNEIDDCIVCDKCAKVCPVDCITIDPIKATEEVGRASDGSPIRLYAATFDIDMAKCCYCGLCTVVCPTECLTMEKKFDYSTFDLNALNYEFANLTPEQADEKRALYEQFVQEKEAAKRSKATPATSQPVADATDVPVSEPVAKPKPAFRPGMKPAATPTADAAKPAETGTPAELTTPASATTPPAKPRPAFRPGMKPGVSPPTVPVSSEPGGEAHALHPLTDPTPDEAERIAMAGIADQPHVTEPLTDAEKNQPVEPADASPVVPKKTAPFRPSMKPAAVVPPVTEPDATAEISVPKPKPAFRPSMKPASSPPVDTELPITPLEDPAGKPAPAADITPVASPKPAFRPTMKPASKTLEPGSQIADAVTPLEPTVTTDSSTDVSATDSAPKPEPAFRPTMKPAPANAAPADEQSGTTEPAPLAELPGEAEPAKPKPAFRPTMKPKSSE